MRLELMTSSLPRMCATTCATSASQKRIYIIKLYTFGGATQNRTGGKGVADLCLTAWLWRHITAYAVSLVGADYGVRTRYLHLGKVALYPMS